jgi:hypothetical protein
LIIGKHAAIHVSKWLSLSSDVIPVGGPSVTGVALIMPFVPGVAVFCKKTTQFV